MGALGRVAMVPLAAVSLLLALLPLLAVIVLGTPGLKPVLADPRTMLAARLGAHAAMLGALAGWTAGVLAALAIWVGTAAWRRLILGAAWLALLMPQRLLTEDLLSSTQHRGAVALLAAGAAQAAPAAGLAALIMIAALNRLDPQILRSAAASGAAPLRAWRMAVLPALAWPLALAGAGAWAICLAHTHPLQPTLGGLLGEATRQHDVAAAPIALLLAGMALAPLLPLGLGALLIRRLA